MDGPPARAELIPNSIVGVHIGAPVITIYKIQPPYTLYQEMIILIWRPLKSENI
jgi:hypothetical protein